MLVQISKADDGMDDWQHLHELQLIRDTVRVPSPLDNVPGEVLALCRWSRARPGDVTVHIKRAFCCAALLRAGEDPPGSLHTSGLNQALALLVVSALELGGELPAALAAFLTWRIPRMPTDDEERPAFAFALAAVALLSSRDHFADSQLEEIAGFVEAVEMDFRDRTGACTIDMFSGSLLDLLHFDQCHHSWQRLALETREKFGVVPAVARMCTRIIGDG